VEHQLVVTPINSWLMAIPQLIARLGTQHKELQGVLIDLLKNIASHFPHAIIWPLLTASQTKKEENEAAARVVMNYICSMYTAGQSGGTRRKGTDQNVHLVAGEVSAVPVVSSRSRRAAGLSDIV
jgi:hypothetical protein